MYQPEIAPQIPVSAKLIASRSRTLDVIAVFFMLAVAAAVPVLAVKVAPLADYVNHLSRMYALAMLDQEPILSQFYAIDWQIIPNLIMDLVVPPLARHVDIFLAGQSFILLTLALMVTGVHAVHFALYRRITPWPLVSFLFVYNNILLFGFMNYLFGLGVALWGIAAWIRLRPANAVLRAAVSTGFVLVLFTCHLFSVGLYGLTLLCYEGWLLAGRRPRSWRMILKAPRTWIDVLAFGLPFVPVIPLMAASPTIGLATDFSYDFGGKWLGVFYLVQNYSDFFDYTVGGLILGGAAWAVWHRLLRLHTLGWILLVAGTATYYAIPRVLFGSWGADLRLPVALAFILMGFMRIDLPTRRVRYAFLAFVVGLSVARFVSVQIAWHNLDVAFQDFRRSVDLIDPGSSILVVQADLKDQKGSEALNQPLSHAACIAMIERSSFVSTAFAVQGKQVLVVKPEYHDMANIRDDDLPSEGDLVNALEDPDSEKENYWYEWTKRFDYVYVLYAGDAPNPAPGVARQIYRGQRFQLFEIEHPDDDDEE